MADGSSRGEEEQWARAPEILANRRAHGGAVPHFCDCVVTSGPGGHIAQCWGEGCPSGHVCRYAHQTGESPTAVHTRITAAASGTTVPLLRTE